jgi:hypothetical protein
VVVYLRTLAEPIRANAGLPSDNLFPLMRFDQLGSYNQIVNIELVREAATIGMLAAAAGIAGRNFHAWLAAFALAFGAWDLAFYGWLRVLIGWPESWFTWDLLFLLPVPWTGPVLAPAIVAASLVIGGAIGLSSNPRPGALAWLGLMLGGALLLTAFMWDWRNIVNGGIPAAFPWMLFAAGELIGAAGFIRALKAR